MSRGFLFVMVILPQNRPQVYYSNSNFSLDHNTVCHSDKIYIFYCSLLYMLSVFFLCQQGGLFVQVFTFHSGQCCVIVIASLCAAYHRYVWRGLGQDLVGEVCATLSEGWLPEKCDSTHSGLSMTGYSDSDEGIKHHLQEVGHSAL